MSQQYYLKLTSGGHWEEVDEYIWHHRKNAIVFEGDQVVPRYSDGECQIIEGQVQVNNVRAEDLPILARRSGVPANQTGQVGALAKPIVMPEQVLIKRFGTILMRLPRTGEVYVKTFSKKFLKLGVAQEEKDD